MLAEKTETPEFEWNEVEARLTKPVVFNQLERLRVEQQKQVVRVQGHPRVATLGKDDLIYRNWRTAGCHAP